MLCAISYHLYNLKNVKNTHGGVLLLVKLQASAYTFGTIQVFYITSYIHLAQFKCLANCLYKKKTFNMAIFSCCKTKCSRLQEGDIVHNT